MWVVVALCILIALTALVLSVPVDLDARVEVHGGPTAYLRVAWLFGRVGKTFRAGEEERAASGGPSGEKERKERKKKKGGRAGRSRGFSARLAWNLLRVPGLARSVPRLVTRLVRCIKVRRLAVDFRVDLGDPSDTAMVIGTASLAARFADLWSRHHFSVTPVFTGEVLLEGDASVALRLRPIATIPPVLAFVFAPSTLKAVVLVVRSRWKRND